MPHLDSAVKLDAMSDEEIRKAVIAAKFPNANMDGKSADYIQARFDAALEAPEASSTTSQRKAVLDGCGGKGEHVAKSDEAAKKYRERLLDGYKTTK